MSDLIEVNREAIQSLVLEKAQALVNDGAGKAFAINVAMRTMAENLLPAVEEAELREFLKQNLVERGKPVQTSQIAEILRRASRGNPQEQYVQIGSDYIKVTRGPVEVTHRGHFGTKATGSKYQELYDLVLELRPGDRPWQFPFNDRKKAEKIRQLVIKLSSPIEKPRNRNPKRLPWPLRVTTHWEPRDDLFPEGAGYLEVYVIQRETE